MTDRVHRELAEGDIRRISDTYHRWKEDYDKLHDEADKRHICIDLPPPYKDIAGFCKSTKLEEIRAHGFVLTPGRYVGAEEAEDDGEPFKQKMKRLAAKLGEQFAESATFEKAIRANLKGLGF